MAWNVDRGMWNVDRRMWIVECGMWNADCGFLSRWFSEEDEDECERDEIHQRKGEVFQKNESEKDECDEAYPVDDAFFYPALVPCISDEEKQVDQWEAKGKYI